MDRGFFIILGAQFLSALADNALLLAAIALLKIQGAPEWHVSMLLWGFTLFYVILAPFAGSFSDAMHKGRVMMLCNGIKLLGCIGMLIGLPPILSYAIVGFGAAAYSSAKYGIVTEYLPHEKLVAANGWLEGATVWAIIFGTFLGGFLSGAWMDSFLERGHIRQWFNVPEFAIAIIAFIYLLAAWLNLYIPKLNVRLKKLHLAPRYLFSEFWWCTKRLWRDPQGGLSMAVTTLFWGAGQTMRLVVINWAIIWLHFSMEQATRLFAVVALGLAFGSLLAGLLVPLKKAFSVLPAGVLMGLSTIAVIFVYNVWIAAILMFIIGALSGFFVVPLNAILQHRGHMLMGAGHSIAVQGFNENLGILVMVGLHALLIKFFSTPINPATSPGVYKAFEASGAPPMYTIIIGFGLFVVISMLFIMRSYRRRQSIMHD